MDENQKPDEPERISRLFGDIEKRFTSHVPTLRRIELMDKARRAALECARILADCAPESRELSIALTKIEEAMFWTNAGIARSDL